MFEGHSAHAATQVISNVYKSADMVATVQRTSVITHAVTHVRSSGFFMQQLLLTLNILHGL